jgi:hypothetical protein
MSEIRFIQAQGDLLDAAIAEASERPPETVLTRLRLLLRPRKRLAVVAVALAVAGCGVAAATGAFSSSNASLAAGLVDCYYGTGPTSSGAVTPGGTDALVTHVPLPAGETPSAVCRQAFEGYSQSALRGFGLLPVHNPRLIACRKNAATIAVFFASGSADQCQDLGLTPLTQGFAAASASAHALATKLQTLYRSRDCWQPRAFVRVAKARLVQYGFTGWRVVLPKPGEAFTMLGTGRCAVFSISDASQSLQGVNRTLSLGLGSPRSISALITGVDDKLAAQQWSSCYSRASVRTLVGKEYASSPMTPKIAVTTNPNGYPGFSWGTVAEARHYQRGCLILVYSWPTINDRTVLVWFMSRNGTHTRATGHPPPLVDFHS